MVNFKKLADRARDVVEQQGGTDALKEKAQRMKEAASGPGSASDKAKAAAQIAREKPNQAAPTAGDDVTGGPIGGGTAPPVSADPAATPATGSPEPDPAVAPATASAADTAPSGSVGDAESTPEVAPVPEVPAEPVKTPPAPEPEDATPSESDESSSSSVGAKDK